MKSVSGRLRGLVQRFVLVSVCLAVGVIAWTATARGQDAAPGTASAPATRPAAMPKLDLTDYVPPWMEMEYEVLGVAVWRLLAAFAFILLGFVLKKIADVLFQRKLIPLAKRTRFGFDTVVATAISRPLGFLFLWGGFFAAVGVLPLPTEPNVEGFVFGVFKVLLTADVVWFLFRIVDAGVERLAQLAARTESQLDNQLVPLIKKALKATIAVVFILWLVQLLGYSVSSLIAGLGIGGLAVALALQDTLSNFFGSIFIFLDRPFTVGDWVKIGDVEGIVEQIGFRSTRIRTWPKSLVSIPNKTVASATVENWSKMPIRRVMQTVGVTYETAPDAMERAVQAIRDILVNDDGVDQELIVVRFTEFGASSLNIFVMYFTKSVAFADHAATKERVNLAIMRALADLGLSIAFPTQTVYLEHQAGQHASHQAPAPEPGTDCGHS